jgi:hypothetical protein
MNEGVHGGTLWCLHPTCLRETEPFSSLEALRRHHTAVHDAVHHQSGCQVWQLTPLQSAQRDAGEWPSSPSLPPPFSVLDIRPPDQTRNQRGTYVTLSPTHLIPMRSIWIPSVIPQSLLSESMTVTLTQVRNVLIPEHHSPGSLLGVAARAGTPGGGAVPPPSGARGWNYPANECGRGRGFAS